MHNIAIVSTPSGITIYINGEHRAHLCVNTDVKETEKLTRVLLPSAEITVGKAGRERKVTESPVLDKLLA
jgi:hypothetical protein